MEALKLRFERNCPLFSATERVWAPCKGEVVGGEVLHAWYCREWWVKQHVLSKFRAEDVYVCVHTCVHCCGTRSFLIWCFCYVCMSVFYCIIWTWTALRRYSQDEYSRHAPRLPRGVHARGGGLHQAPRRQPVAIRQNTHHQQWRGGWVVGAHQQHRIRIQGWCWWRSGALRMQRPCTKGCMCVRMYICRCVYVCSGGSFVFILECVGYGVQLHEQAHPSINEYDGRQRLYSDEHDEAILLHGPPLARTGV